MKQLFRKNTILGCTCILMIAPYGGAFGRISGAEQRIRHTSGTLPAEPPVRELSDQHSEPAWRIRDSVAAVARATEILGLRLEPSNAVKAEIVICDDLTTPFLQNQLIGRRVWHLQLKDVDLLDRSKVEREAGSRPSPLRQLDVYLAPETGVLLKMTACRSGDEKNAAPEPSAASATQQIADGSETWHSFPGDLPKFTLRQALEIVQVNGGDASGAKYIAVHCVRWSRMNQPMRTVWSINLWGTIPFEAAFPGVPEDARNHLRHIIDADTGKWLSATTCPQPDQPVVPSGEKKSEPEATPPSDGG